jgi:hypothetical protein
MCELSKSNLPMVLWLPPSPCSISLLFNHNYSNNPGPNLSLPSRFPWPHRPSLSLPQGGWPSCLNLGSGENNHKGEHREEIRQPGPLNLTQAISHNTPSDMCCLQLEFWFNQDSSCLCFRETRTPLRLTQTQAHQKLRGRSKISVKAYH